MSFQIFKCLHVCISCASVIVGYFTKLLTTDIHVLLKMKSKYTNASKFKVIINHAKFLSEIPQRSDQNQEGRIFKNWRNLNNYKATKSVSPPKSYILNFFGMPEAPLDKIMGLNKCQLEEHLPPKILSSLHPVSCNYISTLFFILVQAKWSMFNLIKDHYNIETWEGSKLW